MAALKAYAKSMTGRCGSRAPMRRSASIFAAAGIAVSAKLLKVQNQQDFYGGMALIFLALVAFVASNDLPGMRGFAFGPGTAPRLFAFTLAALSVIVAVGGLAFIGRYLTRPLMRLIALADVREIFTAFALLLVIGIAQLMSFAGLSMALGAAAHGAQSRGHSG